MGRFGSNVRVLTEVGVEPLDTSRLGALIGPERAEAFADVAARTPRRSTGVRW